VVFDLRRLVTGHDETEGVAAPSRRRPTGRLIVFIQHMTKEENCVRWNSVTYLLTTMICMASGCATDPVDATETDDQLPADGAEIAGSAAALSNPEPDVRSLAFLGQIYFQNDKSGRCIGVDGASTANGALVKQFGCAPGSPNQTWTATSGNPTTLVDVKSSKCMGVDGASVNPGANIGQFNCGNRAPNQLWSIINQGGPDWHIKNSKSGLCIGVDGASTANGAQLKQFACNEQAPNQNWAVFVR
jgi:hypothetical protein